MGIVYRVFFFFFFFFVWGGGGQEFYHRFMYIAPSSDSSLLTLNLLFKVILKRFEVVF